MVATIRSDAALAAGLKGVGASERSPSRIEADLAGAPRGGDPAVRTAISNTPEAAALALLRGGLQRALSALDVAIGVGGGALGQIAAARDVAAEYASAAPQDRAALAARFKAMVQQTEDLVDSAWADGVNLLAGAPSGGVKVSAALDGADPFVISPEDFRGAAGLSPGDPDAVGATLSRMSDGLARLARDARKLEAHISFLGRLDDVVQTLGPGSAPLDADGARLQALGVQQALQGAGLAIANATPASVLSLFRD
jgi:flagellin